MAGYGLQFQPGVPQNGINGNGQARGRVQEPVQILSTRLPKIFGAGAIAPPSLLPGGGGGGAPFFGFLFVVNSFAGGMWVDYSIKLEPHARNIGDG